MEQSDDVKYSMERPIELLIGESNDGPYKPGFKCHRGLTVGLETPTPCYDCVTTSAMIVTC